MAKEMAFWHEMSATDLSFFLSSVTRPYQEFCRIGHEREQSDAQELLIDVHTFQYYVHSVDQDFCDDRVEDRST